MGRESKGDPRDKLPSTHIDVAISSVVEFHILLIRIPRNGSVHDLIDHHVTAQEGTVRRSGRAARHFTESPSSIRNTPRGNPGGLSLEPHRIQHASPIGINQKYLFSLPV